MSHVKWMKIYGFHNVRRSLKKIKAFKDSERYRGRCRPSATAAR